MVCGLWEYMRFDRILDCHKMAGILVGWYINDKILAGFYIHEREISIGCHRKGKDISRQSFLL